jgi:hypothetical protein
MVDVQERLDGLLASFMIKGVIIGRNAGEIAPDRGRGPAKRFCRLTFFMEGSGGATKSVDVSLPDTMNAEGYQEGQYVELPVMITMFDGKLIVRGIDPNVNARAVGQAARDPNRGNAGVARALDPTTAMKATATKAA